MKQLIAFLITLFLSVPAIFAQNTAQQTVADTPASFNLNPEQIALDYFIACLDSFSMDAYNGYRFNKSKDKVYFSGATELFDDLTLGNFKTYSFKKKKFIDAGSFNDRNRLLTCEKMPRKLNSRYKHLVKAQGAQRKATDALIAISNAYFYDNNYYVRIRIDQGSDLVQTYFYARIDAQGQPVNWVLTNDIQ